MPECPPFTDSQALCHLRNFCTPLAPFSSSDVHTGHSTKSLYSVQFCLLSAHHQSAILWMVLVYTITNLPMTLCSSDIRNGLALLADCTATVKQWYLENGRLLYADKSEAICLGTSTQLCSSSAAVDTVTIVGATLPISKVIRSLGVLTGI